MYAYIYTYIYTYIYIYIYKIPAYTYMYKSFLCAHILYKIFLSVRVCVYTQERCSYAHMYVQDVLLKLESCLCISACMYHVHAYVMCIGRSHPPEHQNAHAFKFSKGLDLACEKARVCVAVCTMTRSIHNHIHMDICCEDDFEMLPKYI